MSAVDYRFLELNSPKDTSAASLNNKTNFTLYQEIINKTTIPNTKNGLLFKPGDSVQGLRVKSWTELVYPLKRLLEDNLIQQLFYFDYIEQGALKINPVFIAVNPEKQEISAIYENIVLFSVKNIKLHLENNFSFNPDQFKEELETNLVQNVSLTSAHYPNSIINLASLLKTLLPEIPMANSVKQVLLGDIETELLSGNHVTKLEQGIYIPVIPGDLAARFSIADDFLKNRICPMYQSISTSALAEIIAEEETYFIEPFPEPSVSFTKKRAEYLHKLLTPHQTGNYPGELAIMTVLLLSSSRQEQLKKEEDMKIEAVIEEYKKNFNSLSENWNEQIYFIFENTIRSTHPAVWNRLKNDKSLAFTTWHLKKEIVYVFTARKSHVFENIIRSMNLLPPDMNWKILAFKTLLEGSEHNLTGIFSDPKTIRQYGNLLKKAYMEYFPWYYPFLIFFRIFRDSFFATAKRKIQIQQSGLQFNYTKREKELETRRIVDRKKFLNEKALEKRNVEITEHLDDMYFGENKIPTITTLMKAAGLKHIEDATDALKQGKFQMIQLIKGGDPANRAILYPLDHEWRGQESRLKKMLFKKIEAFVEKEPEDRNYILPYKILYSHIIALNKPGTGNTGSESFPE